MAGTITQLLIRTVKGNAAAGDKLVGLLQVLAKALDGDERHIKLTNPGEQYLDSLERLRHQIIEYGRLCDQLKAGERPDRNGSGHRRLPAN